MIGRHHILEIEFIEKTVLPTDWLARHRFDPRAVSSLAGNRSNSSRTKDFFNSLGQFQTWALPKELDSQITTSRAIVIN
jgi:hypothetical protein